jgi:DNA-binding PucR family transcriptional regulator
VSTRRQGENRPERSRRIAGSPQPWQPETAAAAADDAGGLDPDLLGDFLDRLAAPGPGHEWNPRIQAEIAAMGARAADEGVNLRALIDLYLSAAWRAWPSLPAVAGAADADAVRAAGRAVLRTCDDVVAALAEGYTAARRAVVRREEAGRREFVEDLLAGTAEPAELLARGELHGLQLTGSTAVALAESTEPFREATPLLAEVGAALAGALGDRDTLVTTREGRLVIVLPALAPTERDRTLAAIRRAVGPDAVLALGRPHPGPSGVARSYREARETLGLGARMRLPERTLLTEDLLAYQVLLRDREALTDLIDTVLAPLRGARGGAEPLLDTLQAYLDTGGNTTRTAAELHLSVRAVTYRLDRIAALTGRHPDDPAHRYTLHTALLGARALGWPESV